MCFYRSIIDLFSNMSGFINSAETVSVPNTFSPDELRQAAVSKKLYLSSQY